MSKTFIVASSNGELEADVETGNVLRVEVDAGGDNFIKKIKTFDVKEWEKTYGHPIKEHDHIDILDLGYHWQRRIGQYTTSRGKELSNDVLAYEPPCEEFRTEALTAKNDSL